jgi:hypothetical protein
MSMSIFILMQNESEHEHEHEHDHEHKHVDEQKHEFEHEHKHVHEQKHDNLELWTLNPKPWTLNLNMNIFERKDFDISHRNSQRPILGWSDVGIKLYFYVISKK